MELVTVRQKELSAKEALFILVGGDKIVMVQILFIKVCVARLTWPLSCLYQCCVSEIY